MANVIDCPKCKAVLHESDVEYFKQLPESVFEIKCKLCGGVSEVHHAAFRKAHTAKEMGNPFVPLHIPVPRD